MIKFSQDDLQRQIFGLRLCQLMQEHKISQGDLASATGITQSKISRYMRSKNEPKLADLAAICVYFNVSPEIFLDSSIPIKPLTEAMQAVNSSVLLGSVEHKNFRDLFQMIQTKLVKIPPKDRQRYIKRLVQIFQLICEE
jgi:transcriptional regulator with XRE-family HTH domain